jgi:4a-hydroxytetrahydrobiopterin dehydratase
MTTANDLASRHCTPLPKGTPPLTEAQVAAYLPLVPEWERDGDTIRRRYKFEDFRAAIAFVNSLVEVAEAEDHHPDITISYSRVTLELSTHSIGGLSDNDFIMAAKLDRLPAP